MTITPISALFTDQYQITMMYAHWKNGSHLHRCAFDLYFRSLPFGNGYAVFAGLERVIGYIKSLHFTHEEISYLKNIHPQIDPNFFTELQAFCFTGDLFAMPEGTIVFPNEPLLRVEGTVMELQLIETALLNFIGYQTLVATKAARIRRVCEHDDLVEFGTRRAQEMDAAIWGARAAYISGFNSTSNLLAGNHFGIPTTGTHSHSWVQNFPTEIDAFRAYAHALPNKVILLVDTYDTLRSGLPNAIQLGLELKERGLHLDAIRLDSGDLAYLSKKAREMLDSAGLTSTSIIASSDLDESTIVHLKSQGAKINAWGIGTRLVTAYDQPALGAVYKMVARVENNAWKPTVKISSNPSKITTPGRKNVYRIIEKSHAKAHGDLILDIDETIDLSKTLTLSHPLHPFRQKKLKQFRAVPLLKSIFKGGNLSYTLPDLDQIRSYHQSEINLFWEEYLRILNPEEYLVSLSSTIRETKQNLLKQIYRELHIRELYPANRYEHK